jgi:ABC-2 type transport system permease protein
VSARPGALERFLAVLRLDLAHNARRPLFWIWLVVLGLLAWGLSNGNVTIESGDADVGGTKAHFTSQFANAQLLALFVPILYAFFMAVGAGMALIQDEELGVGPLLHATPLRAGEYVWGKYLAGLVSFLAMLALHLAFAVFFNHAVPDAEAAERVGPLALASYLVPALVFAVPAIVALSGLSFALGTWTRRPILVFFFPVALLLFDVFFLWEEPPEWMPEGLNRALMLLDPSGFRWLNERWLRADRGVEFYNQASIPLAADFLVSRLAYVGVGLAAVAAAGWRFARTLRGVRGQGAGAIAPGRPDLERGTGPLADGHLALSTLGMRASAPGFLAGATAVARVEFHALVRSPGLYLFVPLILVQTVSNVLYSKGVFETRRLLTSGTLATGSLGMLTTLIALLLLFYAVESLRREAATGLEPIHAATPLGTTALLAGKAVACALVAVVTLLAAFGACMAVLLVQGDVALEVWPFVLVWGVLLVPTFLLWSSFVSFLYCLTRSAYTTYALGLGTLILTAWRIGTDELTWVTNWPLWGALRWSDIGTFELVRTELLLNRLLALAAAVLFLFLTVRLHPRRQGDATAQLLRLRPMPLLRAGLRLVPVWVPVLVLGVVLDARVGAGFQGEQAEKDGKDYWRKNVNTWKDAPTPDLAGVELTLELEPEARRLEVQGEYVLENRGSEALRVVPVSRGLSWRRPASAPPPEAGAAGDAGASLPLWTLDGAPFTPEDAKGLALFRLPEPLLPGARLRLGFHFEDELPRGATKNGGGAEEFVLPSSVVLTSFGTSLAPWIGFLEGRGVDEENESDAREYPDDFYLGLTPSAFGPASAPYPVKTTIRGPAEFMLNGVGTLVSDEVVDGRRTSVWQSEHPVRFFNAVAGRWSVAEGRGVAIYHDPRHAHNVPQMLQALEAARERYSEWFHPYPWERLKLSEFAGLAGYAQGFATNITFSEAIGFLTRAEETPADAPFLVTAHEAAHQWWGNLLVPGKGPGGDVLSEGMAHFSTLLLLEDQRGLEARIAFAERIEEQYGEQRVADSERPLVRLDGSRPGDTTVTYDKGGWVFWMLLNAMGREANLAGLRAFLAQNLTARDHPVLQDFLATLRPFAADAAAFDDFARQWFHEVVLPEYRLSGVERRARDGGGWSVDFTLTNAGTGKMAVEVAAVRGQRFPPRAGEGGEPANDAEPYREARVGALLGAGESVALTLECPFEPSELRTDPDALVLMLKRKAARHAF